MSRIVTPIPDPAGETTLEDERGIGCWLDYIEFRLPDGKSYILDVEKEFATRVLGHCGAILPSVVLMPCRLTALLYAHCSFNGDYKEASGVNNFLREGRIVNYMRMHKVASLVAVTPALAEALYALAEPRIEESLYLVLDPDKAPLRYEPIRQQVLAFLREQEQQWAEQQTLMGKIKRFLKSLIGIRS